MDRQLLKRIIIVAGFILLPLILNVAATIDQFMNFGWYLYPIHGKITSAVLYLANWPSILFKQLPYVTWIDGKISYQLLGWQKFGVSAINSAIWCLPGLFIAYVLKSSPSKGVK